MRFVGELFKKSSPTPLKNFLTGIIQIDSSIHQQTDDARRKSRFCYREPVGTTNPTS